MKSNLLKLELMDGQERLMEALEMRGFLIKENGPFLTLAEGSTVYDSYSLRVLLKKYNIPIFWSGRNFQLLTTRFPVALMKRITIEPGREFPVKMNDYHYKWKAFVNRKHGLKVNTMELDPYIAFLVKATNLAGISCLAGCEGHLRYAPNLQLSGVYNGAWFHIVQKRYLQQLNLNYTWEIIFDTSSGASLVAKKEETEQWDMKKIYADTLQMAYQLKEHAEKIKEIKLTTFKRNKQMKNIAETFRKNKDYDGLIKWMESLAFDKS